MLSHLIKKIIKKIALRRSDRYLHDGYSQAKWVLCLLEKASKYGLHYSVSTGTLDSHRTNHVIHDLQTLIWQAAFIQSAPQNTSGFRNDTVDHVDSNRLLNFLNQASVYTRSYCPIRADALFNWHQSKWIHTLVPSWQEWKHRLIQVGKEDQHSSLLILGSSLNRFNQMSYRSSLSY